MQMAPQLVRTMLYNHSRIDKLLQQWLLNWDVVWEVTLYVMSLGSGMHITGNIQSLQCMPTIPKIVDHISQIAVYHFHCFAVACNNFTFKTIMTWIFSHTSPWYCRHMCLETPRCFQHNTLLTSGTTQHVAVLCRYYCFPFLYAQTAIKIADGNVNKAFVQERTGPLSVYAPASLQTGSCTYIHFSTKITIFVLCNYLASPNWLNPKIACLPIKSLKTFHLIWKQPKKISLSEIFIPLHAFISMRYVIHQWDFAWFFVRFQFHLSVFTSPVPLFHCTGPHMKGLKNLTHFSYSKSIKKISIWQCSIDVLTLN